MWTLRRAEPGSSRWSQASHSWFCFLDSSFPLLPSCSSLLPMHTEALLTFTSGRDRPVLRKHGFQQTDVSEDSDDDVDEDGIFGFISLLNLTERKGTPCAEQIKEFILRLCEKNCEKSMVEQLDKLFNDATRPVGFLLSERFINVPPQIALPMHQQLQKELAEAHKTNKPCGKCYFYLLISKTFVEAGKGNSKKKWSSQKKDELMFANAEEEFFYEKAILKFNYSVQEESDTCLGGRWSFDDVPMKPLRTVMLIPSDKMNEIMDKLKEHLSV
ncbi:BRCA2 and CDKN1A-interacting protein isoform 2-T2 [Megaptera novaeangliae]